MGEDAPVEVVEGDGGAWLYRGIGAVVDGGEAFDVGEVAAEGGGAGGSFWAEAVLDLDVAFAVGGFGEDLIEPVLDVFGVPGEDGGAAGGGEAGDGWDVVDGIAEGVGFEAAVGGAEEVEVAGEFCVGDVGFDGGGVGVPEACGVAEDVELECFGEGGLEYELLALDALEVGVVFAVAAKGDGVVAVEVVGSGREFDPDGVDVVVGVVPGGDGKVGGDVDVDAAEGIDEELDAFEVEDDVVVDGDTEVELEVGLEFFDAAADGAGGADAIAEGLVDAALAVVAGFGVGDVDPEVAGEAEDGGGFGDGVDGGDHDGVGEVAAVGVVFELVAGAFVDAEDEEVDAFAEDAFLAGAGDAYEGGVEAGEGADESEVGEGAAGKEGGGDACEEGDAGVGAGEGEGEEGEDEEEALGGGEEGARGGGWPGCAARMGIGGALDAACHGVQATRRPAGGSNVGFYGVFTGVRRW